MPHRGMERTDRQIDRERENERQGMKRGCHVYVRARVYVTRIYTRVRRQVYVCTWRSQRKSVQDAHERVKRRGGIKKGTSH